MQSDVCPKISAVFMEKGKDKKIEFIKTDNEDSMFIVDCVKDLLNKLYEIRRFKRVVILASLSNDKSYEITIEEKKG